MRILLIEDDDRIRTDVAAALKAAGYIVDSEANGEEGWFLGDTEVYGAVVLDLGLPMMDGLTILKKWRKAGHKMPVLILTARGAWNERVEGIDASADDYLPKPFHIEELLARLCGARAGMLPRRSLLPRRSWTNVKCGSACAAFR